MYHRQAPPAKHGHWHAHMGWEVWVIVRFVSLPQALAENIHMEGVLALAMC